jgi:ubiquinone/menaquinone biosynthesis C-methylase UbiE
MSWYDAFSHFYDAALDRVYREPRQRACEALQLQPGARVADLACGTGQSFGLLREKITESGMLLGLELSSGMLAKAQQRVVRAGWQNVRCFEANVCEADFAEQTSVAKVDAIHIFLGMTVIPDWRRAFEHSFSWLASGGRYVIADVYAQNPGVYGRYVNWVARADISREVWQPLEAISKDFQLTRYRAHWSHGGDFVIASGTKI